MPKATATLKQLRKATMLTNRSFHKNGPKSYKKGVGALIKILYKNDGALVTRDLIETCGFDRRELRNVARKAQRRGFVEIKSNGEKSYTVSITEKGSEIAAKRCASQEKEAENILSALSSDEIAQLNTLTEKLIISCKERNVHAKHKSGRKHPCRHHHVGRAYHRCHRYI